MAARLRARRALAGAAAALVLTLCGSTVHAQGLFATYKDDLAAFFAGDVEGYQKFDALITRVRTEAGLAIVAADWPDYRALAFWRWENQTLLRRMSNKSHDSAQTFDFDGGGRYVTLEAQLLAVWAPPPDPPPPPPDPPRNGNVRISGHSFVDDEGPFIGVGFTCMWCLRGAMDFPENTQDNLDFMADRGFNYARILTVVGGSYWSRPPDRRIDPGRADYWESFDLLFEMAGRAGSVPGRRGIKLNVVIFGDVTEFLTSRGEQLDWLDQMVGYLEQHRDQIAFVEVANESTGIGLEADALKILTDHWMASTDIPSAISAIYDYDEDLVGHTGIIGLEKFFDKYPSTSIDILTPHFDRDLREEAYRSARQSWEVQFYDHVPTGVFVNNEPIGCGSSGATICDPDRLVADLLNTMMAKGAAYTYHTDQGVKGVRDFWRVAQIEEFSLAVRSMLNLLPEDIASGVNANHHWDNHPFDYRAVPDQIWTETNGTGVTRAFAMQNAGRWYVVLTGMRQTYEFSPRWPMTVEVFAALDGELLETVVLRAGERHTVRQRDSSTRTYVLRVSRR